MLGLSLTFNTPQLSLIQHLYLFTFRRPPGHYSCCTHYRGRSFNILTSSQVLLVSIAPSDLYRDTSVTTSYDSLLSLLL